MRQIFLFVLLIVAAGNYSFLQRKKFAPPGTVQISEHLFFDATEVTCLSWLEYQHWTKNMYGSASDAYKSTLIDSTGWDVEQVKNTWNNAKPLTLEMRDLPVVGITQQQAIAFCKWRTDRVKYFLSLRKNKLQVKFEYRLPTESEWEFVSDGSGAIFYSGYKAGPGANIKSVENQSAGLVRVASYKPNLHGLYDITGNVAEMIAEPGIAKGGSCVNLPEECRNGKQLPYTTAKPWLGFRCVCVVD